MPTYSISLVIHRLCLSHERLVQCLLPLASCQAEMNDCLLSLVHSKSLASCSAFPCPALSALCFGSSIRSFLRSRVPLFISNESFASQGSCVATIALNCCNYILLAPAESLYAPISPQFSLVLNHCNIMRIIIRATYMNAAMLIKRKMQQLKPKIIM